VRERRPRSSKAWMAFLTVCEPHPKLLAISGGESPRELVRSIWHRRLTKASLERSAVSNCSFSMSESERTKIGGPWFPLSRLTRHLFWICIRENQLVPRTCYGLPDGTGPPNTRGLVYLQDSSPIDTEVRSRAWGASDTRPTCPTPSGSSSAPTFRPPVSEIVPGRAARRRY
jgi:hypothetical protein